MPVHPISLDKKIVLILFASISFTLLLFGFVFSVLLTDLYQDSSKNDLLDSIQIFQQDLQTKQKQLSKQVNLLKNNEELISSVNLLLLLITHIRLCYG